MFWNKNCCCHIQLYGGSNRRILWKRFRSKSTLSSRALVILNTITLRVKIRKENHSLFSDTNPLRPNKVGKCPERGICV